MEIINWRHIWEAIPDVVETLILLAIVIGVLMWSVLILEKVE